jgi:sugar O-acyltransferase (sialic acid O-acetyltransferase NeuD family)
MLILGAGGHALEILDVWQELSGGGEVYLYDDINLSKKEIHGIAILKSLDEVQAKLSSAFPFIIGVGLPVARKNFYDKFSMAGGKLYPIKSSASFVSPYTLNTAFDVMKNCFIGPDTSIGTGALINTGAQVHHQASIGMFTEISPRAVILGSVVIGAYSRIGANCTILPNIKIGDNVTVGAGSVVTKDISDNSMAAGVPAIIKKQLPPLRF